MVFVDGENIVMRYQALLAEGRKPKKGVTHIKDVFVWSDSIFDWSVFDLRRVSYYSTVVGDDKKIEELGYHIGGTVYGYSHELDSDVPKAFTQIIPHLFKKEKQSRKTRMIDIQIVIDIMRHALSNSIDAIYIISGDGDYLPLIDEVMRHGKQVYVSAFDSGLNYKITSRVDQFTYLDDEFFEPKKA